MNAARHRDWDQGRRWPALGLIAGLHLGALWALLHVPEVQDTVQEMAPLMVSLITVAPPAPPPRVEPPPPQPKPQTQPPRREAVVLAATTPEPAVMAPQPPPEAEPVAPAEAPPPAPAETALAEPELVPPDFVAAYLDNPAPPYPLASRRLKERGTVVLRVRVNLQGRAEQVEIETSSGHARLDQSALDTVRLWKFVPARQGSQSVPAWVRVPVNFDFNKP